MKTYTTSDVSITVYCFYWNIIVDEFKPITKLVKHTLYCHLTLTKFKTNHLWS